MSPPPDPRDTHPSFRSADLPRNGNGNGNGNGHGEDGDRALSDIPTRLLIEEIARSQERTGDKVDSLIDDGRAQRIQLDRVETDLRAVRGDVASLHSGVFEAVSVARRTELTVDRIARRVGVAEADAGRAVAMASRAASEASRGSWTDEVARTAAEAGIRATERQREASLAARAKAWGTAIAVAKYAGFGLAALALGWLGAHGCK